MTESDTICAIATPPGNGAIAVIRLSGSRAIAITDKIFLSPTGKKLSAQAPNTVHFGQIFDSNRQLVDEVLVSLFRAPHSYTGEDSAEISCHGSLFIQQKLLDVLIAHGARLAQPGEYTQRAFLNGKMDLAQAEAVADLIASNSRAAHKTALQQMRGGISNELAGLRTRLVEFTSLLELELDFAEEDVEFADRQKLSALLGQICQRIEKLLASFEVGNAIKNGVPVAIVGPPNVGKSTLLNALLNEDRAIVSEIPGTTRDTIEDTIVVEGLTFRFIDTAGLRHTSDQVETLGIERSRKTIEQSEIVILLSEAQTPQNHLQQSIESILQKQKKLLVVFNKIDQQLPEKPELPENVEALSISAKERQNIDQLLEKLVALTGYRKYEQEAVIVSNMRHKEALNKAYQAAQRAAQGLASELSSDLVAQDIREVLFYIGSITGQISDNEILENIFQNFCIGK